MPHANPAAPLDPDVALVRDALSRAPDTTSVARFVPGPGIARLSLRFDPDRLRGALAETLSREGWAGDHREQGFGGIPLTRRPGQREWTDNDLSGRYWLRTEFYEEEPREEVVDEAAFREIAPVARGTYFEDVLRALASRFTLGRVRLLSKGLYNCNSWHRDPEPRLHLPIVTNPGSLFVVNHHATHLPADGSVYFADTRGYHTALNGGEQRRVHLVAALVR